MYLKEPRLSRSQERKYRLRLQQLRAEGHDFVIPEQWSNNDDALVIQVYNPLGNVILDPGIVGGVGYFAVWVRMIAQRPNVTLLDHEFRTDWDDQIELVNAELRDQLWLLRLFDIVEKEVLNSRFETPLRFSNRGQVIEGWLVAAGSRPIPPQYRGGASVRFQLVFRDQFDGKIEAEADLSVRRLKSAPARPVSGLSDPTEGEKPPAVSGAKGSVRPRVGAVK